MSIMMLRVVLKLSSVFVLLTFFAQCLACDTSCESTPSNSSVLSRSKRHLDFIKSSRVFVRANIKENTFVWGAIWAYAQGWKASLNILNNNKALRPYRRDTYEVLQELLDLHGLDGKACLLKAFCTATQTSDGEMANGMLFKLLRHMFKLNEQDKKHFDYLRDDNCHQILHHHCPLSFNNASPFTDDI